ncbi:MULTISPECIES: hypothetical protein [Serratia]|uniref:hypothetical protein n=1 Tax=Serratia TaxID=613 RepID=UPI000660A8F9|nr:hypothetical protein [Serratia sp. 506_PEND]HBC7419292.1 hypothetical protein [Serratia marcescens]
MANYAKLGEFTSYSLQAKDAAQRRYALLHNFAAKLSNLKEQPEPAITMDNLSLDMQEIVKADKEMRVALEEANKAAVLCGQNELSLYRLLDRSSN